MADTSLIFSIIARDKTGMVFKKIQAQAASTGKLVGMALGPAILPAAAVSTGALLGVGAALAGAGVAAGVFGGVMATAITEVNEQATKFTALGDKVELYGKQAEIMAARGEDNTKMLKKQAAAMLELDARLALLPPGTRDAVVAFQGMKSSWKSFVEVNKPATFATLASGYSLMGTVVKKLQPFFDIGKAAADRLLGSLTKMVAGGGIERLAARAGPAMASLTSIIINVSTALTRMFGKFGGEGQGILMWLETVTTKWADWASATDKDTGLNKFFNYVQANGPQVVTLLTNFALAAMHIAQAVAPLAPVSMAIASALASIIQAIPPGVITAIVAGFVAFNVALKLYALYTGIATAVQWAYNVALTANPIGIIIVAIGALIALIIYLATKTQFFQTIWGAVWGFMKMIGAWFAGPFAGFFVRTWNTIVQGWNFLKASFMFGVNYIKGLLVSWSNYVARIAQNIINRFMAVVNFVRSAPGRIAGSLRNMFNGLWEGFRNVVNMIISGWNNLSFGIPSFSFAGHTIGGMSVGTPDIPYLAKGAGSVQQSGLAFIHRGESVTPAARVSPYRSTGGGGGGTLIIKGDGSRVAAFLLEVLREAIRDKGGDPVKVLTSA